MSYLTNGQLVTAGAAIEYGFAPLTLQAATKKGYIPFSVVEGHRHFFRNDLAVFASKVYKKCTGRGGKQFTVDALIKLYGESEDVGRPFSLESWKSMAVINRGWSTVPELKVETVEQTQEEIIASLRPGRLVKVFHDKGEVLLSEVESVRFDAKGEVIAVTLRGNAFPSWDEEEKPRIELA